MLLIEFLVRVVEVIFILRAFFKLIFHVEEIYLFISYDQRAVSRNILTPEELAKWHHRNEKSENEYEHLERFELFLSRHWLIYVKKIIETFWKIPRVIFKSNRRKRIIILFARIFWEWDFRYFRFYNFFLLQELFLPKCFVEVFIFHKPQIELLFDFSCLRSEHL